MLPLVQCCLMTQQGLIAAMLGQTYNIQDHNNHLEVPTKVLCTLHHTSWVRPTTSKTTFLSRVPLATKPGLIGKHFMGLKLVFQSKQCEPARINWKPHGAQAQHELVGLAGEEIGGCGDPLLCTDSIRRPPPMDVILHHWANYNSHQNLPHGTFVNLKGKIGNIRILNKTVSCLSDH